MFPARSVLRGLVRWSAALLVASSVSALEPQPAATGTLSQKDRDYGVASFLETRQKLLSAISGLSEAQWNFKPAPDRWSIAEVTEHIAVSEPVLLKLVTGHIVKAAPVEIPADKRITDARVFELTLDRTVKNKAPEMLQPKKRWPTQAELMKAFIDAREQTLDYMRTTQDDLRAHASAHSGLGLPDAFQWMLFISAHSARHTLQIEEVKADSRYPKS